MSETKENTIVNRGTNKNIEQARIFLNKVNAKCEIVYGGISRNESWKEMEREIGMM